MSSSLSVASAKSWTSFAGPIGSNARQAYLTHSLLRYFGKLPPVLTGQILAKFARSTGSLPPLVLDMMCGSGTTLVESQRLGMLGVGIDVNPLALLASRVKTRELPSDAASKVVTAAGELIASLPADPGSPETWDEPIRERIPEFPNRDRWFPSQVQFDLAALGLWIESLDVTVAVREFVLLTWLSIIRQASQASVRTGRIFYDANKSEQNVRTLFADRLKRNIEVFKDIPPTHFRVPVEIQEGDSRVINVPLERKADLTLLHPPYFALYKYSSDVLRFELEWNRSARKEIAKREIEDGFKTTRAELMVNYVADVLSVLQNAVRHTRPGGVVVTVVGNSTLSERQLPIVSELIAGCMTRGWVLESLFERDIDHSQVKYHRSAKANIRSDSDYVLVIRT